MVTLNEIRLRLTDAIRTSGKKPGQIAGEIGLTQQGVSAYLEGRAMPALDTFANLCSALDVDPGYILCLRD